MQVLCFVCNDLDCFQLEKEVPKINMVKIISNNAKHTVVTTQ